MKTDIIQADTRKLPLADDSVDLIVTSPPYWSLRSYEDAGTAYAGQIGSEPTYAEYIDTLVDCTREWLRVLKPTGSLWVNLGDKYGPKKSLLGLPWRYALAGIDELGLILRAEVIWHKTNGFPESVTDRVRRSHENWFHFTQQQQYFSSVNDIREPHAKDRARGVGGYDGSNGLHRHGFTSTQHALGKLPGSVWPTAVGNLHVPPELGVNHYASFPVEWPKRIITGWSPQGGTVLDPMGGTGTTAMVASVLGRHGISVDASADYCRIAEWRVNDPRERGKVR